MRHGWPVMILLAAGVAGVARADEGAFAFTDAKGYEKCLRMDHMVETVKTAKGAQQRMLGELEIRDRCLAAAEKLLGGSKDRAKLMEFVKITKRNAAHEDSLGLIRLLVTVDVKACNDMEIYGVLLKALAHPKSYPSSSDSWFDGVGKVVTPCLKDAEFKQDFREEKDNANSYIAANACELLVAAKLEKSCKKAED